MYFCPGCKYTLVLEKGDKDETGKWKCACCGYSTPLVNGTVVLDTTNKKRDGTMRDFDPVSAVTDLYPRKKLRRCEGCSTKQPEVVVWKDEDFNVLYVCTSCKTVMNCT